MTETEFQGSQRLMRSFMWFVVVLGFAVCAFSIYRFPVEQLNVRLLLLALVTLLLASRIAVNIPLVKGTFTASETFIFITFLLYGGEAAILLATLEITISSSPYSKTKLTVLFNAAMLAVSTFLTVWALQLFFDPRKLLLETNFSVVYVAMIALMAFVQYTANSSLAAIRTALRSGQSIFGTWRDHFLWTWIGYAASASTAGITAKLIIHFGFAAFLLTVPMIAVVYFTYKTYQKNVEAAAEKAAVAERHVEELNIYIAEQERIREQFSQIEKLSALGELSSGVAHNFNNTLSGILARAQLLLKGDALPDEVRRGLKLIVNTAEDGAKTVKRIQDFARQRRDQMFEPIAVDQLLRDVGEITRPRWKDQAEADNIHINLTLEIESTDTIMGNGGELREVLVNMVFNAVDAMPAGGRLTLAARRDNGYVEISVRDTGQGMSEEVRSRIFDPFFTTKGQSGMGLGLAVSYGTISRHDGTLQVESEAGRGATFKIKLPIADETIAPMTDAEPVKPTFVAGREAIKILVVEDEDYLRELLEDILSEVNCEVVLAGTGDEGLKLFESGDFAAVFTDVGLPGMSGWELARHIRARDGQMPIAVITGWGDTISLEEREAARVDWIVPKPFTLERIIELAGEVSSRHAQATG